MMGVPLDVRYGFRKLNNNAGFTAVAVFCLALGICASVTVFSIVNALILRPIPGVTGQDRIVTLASKPITLEGMGGKLFSQPLSYPQFLRYREANRVFSDLVAYWPFPANLVAGGEPLRVTGQVVTDNYFTALGLPGHQGRVFTPGEGLRETQPEVVVSHVLWQRLSGDRRPITGSSLHLNGHFFMVIGVAPEGFRGTVQGDEVDLWVPMESAPLVLPALRDGKLLDAGHAWLFWFFGRLAPGVDVEHAQTEMNLLADRLAESGLEGQRPPELQIYPGLGHRPGTRGALASPLALLASVVALLMLVVCANLGGLLLVKAAARQEEIGVRLALGVTRGRLIRQLLSESVALSLLGGIAGFMMALWAIDALQGISLGQYLPRTSNLGVDWRVAAFTLALSLSAGVVFGLLPAWWSTRRHLVPLLHRGAGTGGQDRGRTRLQEMFVVGQLTVSLILLIITGLFVRTLRNLQSIDPGFDSAGVLDLRIDLSLQGYSEPSGLVFYDRLLSQVRVLPGVQSAALAFRVPLSSIDQAGGLAGLQPQAGPAAGGDQLWSEFNVVTPGYFRTVGIPLLRGRDFSAEDRQDAPPVMIVDETVAAALWPGRNPVGERLALSVDEVREVVGVARNVRFRDLQADPKPYFYLPLSQRYQPALALQVKAAGDPLQAVDPVRSVLRKLDPNLGITLHRFDDEVQEALAQPRLFSWLFGSFSLVALAITAIGLYGTLAYAVSRRTRELGIRMALGARASEIVGLVLRRGLVLTSTGLILGLGAASWATSVFSGYLFGVTPTDPGVFLSVALLLALVGLAASSLPAYSATRVDPMAVIRHE
ncbi:MAG TPA: ABC transporter permease [Thermoanaerobaculia bacterium]|nr:ABC transporter permease [Thermoanaerobaculia bacterium]